jgi:AcrR family transcriptional regulator
LSNVNIVDICDSSPMGGERGRSKQAIFAAATDLFADRGYAATSVREIAQEAVVDPALVIRHFGSKELLFIETMQLAADEVLHIDPPLDTLGERIVRFVVTTESKLRSTYLGLVRASDTEGVATVLRELHEEQFVAPVLRLLEGRDRELRARLAAAMVGGLMYSLWTVEDGGLLGADHEALIATYAPALQGLLTPRHEPAQSVSSLSSKIYAATGLAARPPL